LLDLRHLTIGHRLCSLLRLLGRLPGGKLGLGSLSLLLGLCFCRGSFGQLALLLRRVRLCLLDLLLLLRRDPGLFGGFGRGGSLVLLGLLGAFGNEPCLLLLGRIRFLLGRRARLLGADLV
jgi:hypothetical protein